MTMFARYGGAILLCGCGAIAHAQYTYSPPVYSPLTAITSDVRYQGTVSSLNANVNEQIIADEPASLAAPAVTPTYRFDRKRSQQNLRNFVSRAPSQEAKASLEQAFAAQPTIIDDIRAGISPYGLDSHNVADAYAMWLINAWLASEKRNIDTDLETVAAVKRQVYAAFAATPGFASSNDVDRQEYAEALLIQGLMLAAGLDQFEGDPSKLEQLSQAARQGAKASGVDLALMTLTPNGFVPRKGVDARGATGAADGTIRTARATAPGEEDETSGVGLALAAGAGFGVVLLGGLAYRRMG